MITALIPARGGSERIPNKNLQDLGGKPLLHWTIHAALDAESVGRVVVTTDSEEIARSANGAGAGVLMRPAELGAAHVPSREVILHAMGEVGVSGDVALLHPTSPFRTGHDIDNAVQMLHGWNGSVVTFTNDEMNGAIYLARSDDVRRVSSFMRLPIRPLHLPMPNGLDIDRPDQLEWARKHVESRMEAACV